jgi:hypothetical protein
MYLWSEFNPQDRSHYAAWWRKWDGFECWQTRSWTSWRAINRGIGASTLNVGPGGKFERDILALAYLNEAKQPINHIGIEDLLHVLVCEIRDRPQCVPQQFVVVWVPDGLR